MHIYTPRLGVATSKWMVCLYTSLIMLSGPGEYQLNIHCSAASASKDFPVLNQRYLLIFAALRVEELPVTVFSELHSEMGSSLISSNRCDGSQPFRKIARSTHSMRYPLCSIGRMILVEACLRPRFCASSYHRDTDALSV